MRRNVKIDKVTDGSNSKRSGALTISLAPSQLDFPTASTPSSLSSSITMDQQQRAIAVCESFQARLSSLDDAMYNTIDDMDPDPELEATGFVPQHFSTNDAYRTTFTVVLAEQFDPRNWRHYTILLQYWHLLNYSVVLDFSLLHYPSQAGFQEAVGRWGSWEAVDARWPFEVPVQTGAGDVARVCRGMWAALRVVAAAALREEDRVGLCEFDVMVEGGVVSRGVPESTEWAAEGVGARLVGWVQRGLGVKMKQD
ncbi:hypothetical protein Q9L58_009384 [Maublancomyces gigas]|uniref:Uncharacterized protein n=1 Tax=Discina gigas TaxID=1032678 RepID=A0ABR3G726_9PEZI